MSLIICFTGIEAKGENSETQEIMCEVAEEYGLSTMNVGFGREHFFCQVRRFHKVLKETRNDIYLFGQSGGALLSLELASLLPNKIKGMCLVNIPLGTRSLRFKTALEDMGFFKTLLFCGYMIRIFGFYRLKCKFERIKNCLVFYSKNDRLITAKKSADRITSYNDNISRTLEGDHRLTREEKYRVSREAIEWFLNVVNQDTNERDKSKMQRVD